MRSTIGLGLLLAAGAAASASADDWPMWQHDAQRTGVTPARVPDRLHLQWTAQYPRLERAWPDEDRMEFDVAYEPVIAGKTLFFGSSRDDALRALATDTGEERWRFYANGPIRFAPCVDGNRVFVASDDGCLYCLDTESGALHWRFQAVPSRRVVLGNTRLISMWPVRGAPVVADGKVYFGAGIWCFEGIFLYALDAISGEVVWSNDNCDVPYIQQPHHSDAFAGVTPQGYLAVNGDRLLVPNGRAVAACFNRSTGDLEYFHLESNNRHGAYHVSTLGDYFFNPSCLYELDEGRNAGVFAAQVALTEDTVYGLDGGRIKAYDFQNLAVERQKDSKNRIYYKWDMPTRWFLGVDATTFIVAGDQVIAAKPGGLCAIAVPGAKGEPKLAWELEVPGTPRNLMAADDRLFVVTEEGDICCFGGKKAEAVTYDHRTATAQGPATESDRRARAMLEATGISEGYCLVGGASDADLLLAVAGQSTLNLTAIEPDSSVVAAARARIDAAPDVNDRIAVLESALPDLDGPAYLANVMLVPDPAAVGLKPEASSARVVFHYVRPYGGIACMGWDANEHAAFAAGVAEAGLENAEVTRSGDWTLLARSGALPGSADWTHQYADAANTVVSKDSRVRLPLGMLWFGGSSNTTILPRHGHGPSEQVIDGRLFIEGPDTIRAMDVYTGRMLWQVELPDIGAPYDNTSHQPGANARGSNYVSVSDGIYVAYGERCLRLDPVTGSQLAEFSLPIPEGHTKAPAFGYLAVWEDLLISGSGPMVFDEEILGLTLNAIASKRVVALDRYSGEALWSTEADVAFRHNAIAVAAGKVFCLDRATDALIEKMERRGMTPPAAHRLLAIDARTGEAIWTNTDCAFGTWLGYSEEHGLLVQAGRSSRDMLTDEVRDRMAALRGADGSVAWDHSVEYSGPLMIHGDTIIAQEQGFSLVTGERLLKTQPITGVDAPWQWTRNHGCNSAIASVNLVLFRSAAAGFFDLERYGGTGNFGGYRSSCTSNLIAANGVLNSPDYTRTCTCSYQNQTSLALVHHPDTEMWTFNNLDLGDAPVARLGLNLGAPGDRMAEDGTLWIEYPYVGGPTPKVPVSVEPDGIQWIRRHSVRMAGDGLKWVGASFGKGITALRVTLGGADPKVHTYTVRLYFAEPDDLDAGERVFDVAVQGKAAVSALDIVAEAGGPMRTIVKQFDGVEVQRDLAIDLSPGKGAPVLSGIEMIAD